VFFIVELDYCIWIGCWSQLMKKIAHRFFHSLPIMHSASPTCTSVNDLWLQR